jgi:hypothetical protein
VDLHLLDRPASLVAGLGLVVVGEQRDERARRDLELAVVEPADLQRPGAVLALDAAHQRGDLLAVAGDADGDLLLGQHVVGDDDHAAGRQQGRRRGEGLLDRGAARSVVDRGVVARATDERVELVEDVEEGDGADPVGPRREVAGVGGAPLDVRVGLGGAAVADDGLVVVDADDVLQAAELGHHLGERAGPGADVDDRGAGRQVAPGQEPGDLLGLVAAGHAADQIAPVRVALATHVLPRLGLGDHGTDVYTPWSDACQSQSGKRECYRPLTGYRPVSGVPPWHTPRR